MFRERLKSHHTSELKSSRLSLPLTKRGLEKRLSLPPKDQSGIIYFHVPYCDKICSFCSMNRSKLDGELEEYTDYLLKEIKYFSQFEYIQGKRFESIYFGGGTPTIMKTKQLERIISSIHQHFNLSETCEFSFESTLHNLNIAKLNMMQDMGVNRYSFGIQTFSNRGRVLLNRTSKQEQIVDKLSRIREIFKGNMCIDIIYNYPKQTQEEIIIDAELSKAVQADSVSFYSLMFHKNSVLSNTISQDYYDLATEKMLHDCFLDTLLDDDKYEMLELTKINMKDRDEYKYIQLSHQGVDLLPIGVGAGGALNGMVGFSPKRDMKFFKKEKEKNYKLKRFAALFQHPKISFQDMKKHINQPTFDKVCAFLEKTQSAGYVELFDDGLSYTREGIFWGNNITRDVLQIAIKETR